MSLGDGMSEMRIIWVADCPTGDIRAVTDAIVPPGDWIDYSKCRAAMDDGVNHLISLKGRSIRGKLIPLINRDMSSIAVGELPAPQKALRFEEWITADKDVVGIDDVAGEDVVNKENQLGNDASRNDAVGPMIADAIQIATDLLKLVQSGQAVDAETLLDHLCRSPDREMTATSLRLAGCGCRATGSTLTYDGGAWPAFPRTLVSREILRMRFFDFGELGESSVSASFRRVHVNGQSEDTDVGRLLETRKRFQIDIANSADSLMFRIAAAGGLSIEAEVTAIVSSFDGSIERLTLQSVVNRSALQGQLEKIIAQLRLPIDHG